MGKTDDKPPVLSEYWNPPDLEVSRDGAGEPVACLATTYEFDAGFFETELLPRFLQLQFHPAAGQPGLDSLLEREQLLASVPVTVFVDAAKLDPAQSTLRWDQVPVEVPGGVQHSKIAVLVWERAIRLLVGSANLTPSGYKRNRELFAALDCFDDSGSAPKSVLIDALDFLEVILGFARVPGKTRERVKDTLSTVRSRVAGWRKAPKQNSRSLPRVYFVPGYPKTQNGAKRSPLAQLQKLAMGPKVGEFAVMTPFVSSTQRQSDPVLERLCKPLAKQKAIGWLICPQEDGTEGGPKRVPLPATFGSAWSRKFADARILPIPARLDDEAPRELHAKAILLERDGSDLLMIGSSNFTAHGMGVGAYNCEANLVFMDKAEKGKGKKLLYERLGGYIKWGDFCTPSVIEWSGVSTASSEVSNGTRIPPFFRWATVSEKTRRLYLHLEWQKPEPRNWEIDRGESSSRELIFSRKMRIQGDEILEYDLGDGIPPCALRIRWLGGAPREWHQGWIAVSVEDAAVDLLPPAPLRDLTWEERAEYLLSGQTLAGWFVRWQSARRPQKSGKKTMTALDAVDTSGYLLYRLRRAGAALTIMARRIVETPRIPFRIRACLLQDPFGPVNFAKALATGSEEGQGPSASSPQDLAVGAGNRELERAFRIFLLVEILLLLKFARRRLCRAKGRASSQVRSLFRKAQEIVNGYISEALKADFRGTPSHMTSLKRYVNQVRRLDKAQSKKGGE